MFVFGDALFGHEFRKEDGYAATAAPVPLRRVHDGRRGGLDTFSCAGCHSQGGPDGSGAATQNAMLLGDGDDVNTALVRNPPMALGLGFVQALAAEMTRDLQRARDEALAQAKDEGSPITIELKSKGVRFGRLTAYPTGFPDTSDVEGVDPDLVVKPFGWKGKFATLRRVVEDAAFVHFGVQSHVLAADHRDDPDPGRMGDGPDWWDPDGDGRQRELEEGTLTAAAVYLAMVESPVILPPHDPELRDRWASGSLLFDDIGCNECHRRELVLRSSTWEERPDTTGAAGVTLNLMLDGEGPKSGARVYLFSDLKRHDLGEALADPVEGDVPGVGRHMWLTRPLWSLAETAPYLHDGRAATIPEAIEVHGGEAREAAEAFAALSTEQQADLHIFLLSLTREPKVRIQL